jgi:hypothetical protein
MIVYVSVNPKIVKNGHTLYQTGLIIKDILAE